MEDRSTIAQRILVRRVLTVQRGGGHAEEVLDRERHARGKMVFELGNGNEDVGLLVRTIDVEGRKEESTPGNLEPAVLCPFAAIASVLEGHTVAAGRLDPRISHPPSVSSSSGGLTEYWLSSTIIRRARHR